MRQRLVTETATRAASWHVLLVLLLLLLLLLLLAPSTSRLPVAPPVPK